MNCFYQVFVHKFWGQMFHCDSGENICHIAVLGCHSERSRPDITQAKICEYFVNISRPVFDKES